MVKDGNWIDRREAAERAGVHYNTIRNWHEGLQLFGPGRYAGSLEGTTDSSGTTTSQRWTGSSQLVALPTGCRAI